MRFAKGTYFPNGPLGKVLLGGEHIYCIGDSLHHRGQLSVKCIFCPSRPRGPLSAAIHVGIHHSTVVPGSSLEMDVRAAKEQSRMCGDITSFDGAWCHGRTLYMSWGNSFLGMVA